MDEQFDIEDQIKSLEMEIAKDTQRLFEAKGALRMLLHLKTKFKMEPIKKDENAPSRPA